MARVRYIVDNVEETTEFYVSKLGFEIERQFGPAIAILVRGDLTLLVSGPKASASRPMSDGTIPSPGGGWNRFVLDFDDLESVVSKLKAEGVKFRNDILDGVGGKQVICEDPAGNVIELTQPRKIPS
ncbi:MAG: VOC family protein [Gammaproteobacteria bacterium]|nr:VOC family protein [Gammaproteobacteria bacterium]